MFHGFQSLYCSCVKACSIWRMPIICYSVHRFAFLCLPFLGDKGVGNEYGQTPIHGLSVADSFKPIRVVAGLACVLFAGYFLSVF